MDDPSWQRIKEVYLAATELPEEERGAYLLDALGDDPGARAEVERLLGLEAEASGFIERPAIADVADRLAADDEAGKVGRRIGAWRIESEIGRGGMGVVYFVERADGQYQQRAALKIAAQAPYSSEIARRFQVERQILASLEHPNIARLLDGGLTEDRLPYLVLELVEGEPIDQYCRRRGIGLEGRVELVREVCSAVAYAHRRLIVHRDLKPGNILVDAGGRPKLLDFGIAKLLAPESGVGPVLQTVTGHQIMTPEYASPEQVLGEPVGTASDVYSLGVLLYQLLTDRRPYELDSRSPAAIERVVVGQLPTRPSAAPIAAAPIAAAPIDGAPIDGGEGTGGEGDGGQSASGARRWRRRLAGDLDTIVLKALAKEPERRYDSVDRLADDLGRWRSGLPVSARPDTVGYRARRFVGRHRAGVGAAVLLLLSLLVGIVATTWQARRARAQRDLAVRTATAMIYELAEGMGRMQGPTEARLGLIERADDLLQEIQAEGADSLEVRRLLADSQRVLAQTYRTLGDLPRSEQSIDRAVASARSLATRPAADAEDLATLSSILAEQGDTLQALGEKESSLAAYSEALVALERALDVPRPSLRRRSFLALLLRRKADAIFYDDLDGAEALYRRALEVDLRLTEEAPDEVDYLVSRAITNERLADVLYARQRWQDSCPGYRQALELRRRAQALKPGDAVVETGLAIALQNSAWCAEMEEDWATAIDLYGQGARLQQTLHEADPGNVALAGNLIRGLTALGQAQLAAGDPVLGEESLVAADELLAQLRREGRSDPGLDAVGQQIQAMLADRGGGPDGS